MTLLRLTDACSQAHFSAQKISPRILAGYGAFFDRPDRGGESVCGYEFRLSTVSGFIQSPAIYSVGIYSI